MIPGQGVAVGGQGLVHQASTKSHLQLTVGDASISKLVFVANYNSSDKLNSCSTVAIS